MVLTDPMRPSLTRTGTVCSGRTGTNIFSDGNFTRSITAYYCTLSLLPITFKLRDRGVLVTRVPLPVLIEMQPRGRIAACSEVQVLYSWIVFVGEFLLFDSFLIVKLQNKFIICKYISNPVMLQISLIDVAWRSTS